MKTIYVHINYGALEENKPSDLVILEPVIINGVKFGDRWLTVIDLTEPRDKPPSGTGYDYVQRSYSLTDVKPSSDVYISRTQFNLTLYPNWKTQSVDDNFQIPVKDRVSVTEYTIDSVINGAKVYALNSGLVGSVYYFDRVDQKLGSESLHDVASEHFTTQLTLMNKALLGEASILDLQAESKFVSDRFHNVYIGSAAVSPVTADIMAKVAFLHSPASLVGFPLPDGTLDDGSIRLYAPASTGGTTIVGSFLNNVFVGGSGPDIARLGEGNDLGVGGDGDDRIEGGSGNDQLAGGRGNDLLIGDAGYDSVSYAGFLRQYSLGRTNDSYTVESVLDGSDTIRGIEEVNFRDGRVVLDVADPVAVVYRLYDSAFKRLPDGIGLNDWTARLFAGFNPEDLANALVSSPEFNQTYGSLSNTSFVQQLYLNVLQRPADAAGLSFHVSALDNNSVNRGQVLLGFSESPEHINLLRPFVMSGIWDMDEASASIARLYYAALDRAPEGAGLMGWKDMTNSGVPLANVADGFAGSAEFQSKYGSLSNEGYVERLYDNVLDRHSDPGGLAMWTGNLNSGQMDRGDVLLGFSESLEFQIKTLPVIDHGIMLA